MGLVFMILFDGISEANLVSPPRKFPSMTTSHSRDQTPTNWQEFRRGLIPFGMPLSQIGHLAPVTESRGVVYVFILCTNSSLIPKHWTQYTYLQDLSIASLSEKVDPPQGSRIEVQSIRRRAKMVWNQLCRKMALAIQDYQHLVMLVVS